MKAKETEKQKVHDLRDLTPVKVAVPDVSGAFAGAVPPPATDGPNIMSPTIGKEPDGQGTSD